MSVEIWFHNIQESTITTYSKIKICMEWILYTVQYFLYTTHSNTLLSFWSPQMRISEMDLRVSTNRLLLASVTVWFLHSKLWRYLLREKTCFVHGYNASHSVILCICLNKSRKKCNVLNKNEYYSLICIIGANIRHFIIGKSTCTCICILSTCIMLCKEMWWAVTC